MIESNIKIHYNTTRPVSEIQNTIRMIRAILDNEVEKNNLSYTIEKLKVV